jgi:hypothetical protein
MKNMYSNLLAFLILLLPTTIFSQQDLVCITPTSSDPDPQGAYSYSTSPIDLEETEPQVLNIFFWQVRGPNGEYNYNFSENSVLKAVADLNMAYNQFNIFFKYRGYSSFDTPGVQKKRWEDSDNDGDFECNVYQEDDPEGYGVIDKCQITSFFSYAISNGYRINDALNIYIPYQCDYFGGAAISIISKQSIVPFYNLDRVALPHEVGHNLGLRHTDNEWLEDDDPIDPCASICCEHVTRNTSDSNYNADCKGDRIDDTNAVPNFKREHYYELIDQGYSEEYAEANYVPYNYIDNCTYIGNGDDCQNQSYLIDPEDVTNTMLPSHPCEDNSLTYGQGHYMRESIEYYSTLRDLKTDVPALYEPYKGEYYVAGPNPNHNIPPLFQPGFDYWFVSCSCDNQDSLDCSEPCPFDITTFQNNHTIVLSIDKYETDYSIITHPNHTSIYIDQLSEYGVRRCYDNWNYGAIGGNVTKFNDGILNTNVTITPKDSIGINNQNLINDLPQGLYKIEKIYNDGTTHQSIIQKENN